MLLGIENVLVCIHLVPLSSIKYIDVVDIRVVPRASFNFPERPTLFGTKYVFGANHQALTRESAALIATQTHLTKWT